MAMKPADRLVVTSLHSGIVYTDAVYRPLETIGQLPYDTLILEISDWWCPADLRKPMRQHAEEMYKRAGEEWTTGFGNTVILGTDWATYYCDKHRDITKRAPAQSRKYHARPICPTCHELMFWVPGRGTVVPPIGEGE